MANILDGICPERSILDDLDDWPRSATHKEWFRLTRELVASTIADMVLDPAAEAEVIEAFTCAGLPCIDQGSIISKRSGIFAWPT